MATAALIGRPSQRPSPRAVESPFSADEIFFSTTDRKGRIRSGNRVFARVSGYSRAELIGSPHNVIRHPDMPRVVFRLLWQTIEAGKPIAAYVKNMAKDGSYYWVLATVVPCDGGYLSVRIKPTTGYFDAAQAVYEDLLAVEQQIEQDGPHRRDAAMAAAGVRLQERLQEAGFADYDAFMRTALLAEVKQRETLRPVTLHDRQSETLTADGRRLLRMLDACGELGAFLRTLVTRIDAYMVLGEQLAEKVQFASELGEDVQLFSLNTLVAASRMGSDAAALGAVSSLMQARSDQARPVFTALTEDVLGASGLLNDILLPVAISRIQAEAALGFVHELLEGRDDECATADDLGALIRCLADEVSTLGARLTEIDRRLRSLVAHVGELKGAMNTMRALELNGRIEAARVDGAEAVVGLFRTIAGSIVQARGQLEELFRASSFSFAREVGDAQRSQQHVATVRELVATLGGSPAAAHT
ncbi:MAG: PAS domain-containing protein [Chloroflexota bacterium]